MKKFPFKIASVGLIALLVLSFSTDIAHAGIFDIDLNLTNFVNFMLASLANVMLTAAGWILALCGALLNISIKITLQISNFVDNAQGIVTTWKAIRDIAGLFFIFFLVYAAFMMIFGISGGKYGYGQILKSIVIAGVLINFSFFIAGIGIDASNVVSVQLYNAIAPANPLNASNFNNNQNIASLTSKLDGGISDIFMQSLRITSIYDISKMNAGQPGPGAAITTGVDAIKIVLTAIVGVMIELIAALSFLGAAFAFIARFVILVFLLAFSPVWFIGFIAPEIKKYTEQWQSTYVAMLLFMPVYLLLMYFAMTVITTTPLFTWDASSSAVPLQGSAMFKGLISLGVNAVLILFLINLPLIAAITVASKAGGKAGKFFDGVANRFNSKIVMSGTWRNTGSRVASRVARSEGFQEIAGKYKLGEMALKGSRAAASSFDQKLSKKVQEREEFAKSLTRRGAANYAERLSTSIPARLSLVGSVGRSDRVGAARILKTRMEEVRTSLNQLTSQLNAINNAATQAGGLVNLPRYQQELHDRLTGNNVTGSNPLHDDEIAEAQTDLNSINTQITDFQTNTGSSIRETNRRNY